MSTKRFEVNAHIALASREFEARAGKLLKAIEDINTYNFDLRDISNKDGVRYLEHTIDTSRTVKVLAIRCKRAVEDILFNLDHFITRNAQDLKKVKGRLDGETTTTQV